MKLTKDQVKHVAKLANLPLTDKEVEKYSEQLSEILNYIDQLNKVDTNNIEPTFNVGNLSNVMREDKAEPGLTQEEALQNAKITEKGFFKVKAIFEER